MLVDEIPFGSSMVVKTASGEDEAVRLEGPVSFVPAWKFLDSSTR
jgi:hypothetical protein